MKISITKWANLIETQGEQVDVTWAELVAILTVPSGPFQGDQKHPGWSPATFRDQRRAQAGVKNVFAICLDYDAGETLDAATGLWGAFTGLVQTTRKHTPEAPRFRVVMPMTRAVSWFEFAALWIRVNAHAGGKLDPAPKDSSRFWFLPSAGEHFESRVFTGGLFDPDEWLRKPEPVAKRVEVVRVRRERTQNEADIERRASNYLAAIPGAVAGNGGHKSTWDAAVAMARGFALSENDTFRMLWHEYNPRCEPQWSEKEIQHKVRGAFNAKKVPLGYLLEQDDARDYQSRSVVVDVEIPDEPEYEYDRETSEVYERQPGDDYEEIEKELAAAPAPEPVKLDTLKQYGVVTLHAMYQAVIDEELRGASAKGFPIGLKDIDDAIGGLRVGNVTLLAAMTSWGKSSFGIMAMANNLGGDARPLIVSVEDKLLLYSKRVTARTCKINALALRDNDLHKADYDKIYKTMMELPNEPVFIDAVGKSVEWVAEAISACCKHLGTKLVICDYVQRFKTNKHAGDKKNQVTYIGETLSDAIKNGGAAGLVLSQVKRTQGKEPTMDDVKESGDLENMAEHVMIGWRLEDKSGPSFGQAAVARRLNIPKNKDGPIVTKWIDLTFDETTASFVTPADVRMRDREQRGYGDYDDIANN